MSGAPDEPDDSAPHHPQPSYDPKKKLQRLIEAVRLPAGPDPRFAMGTVEAAHRDEFTAAVHSTWKDVQAEVIEEIISIERVLARGEAGAYTGGDG